LTVIVGGMQEVTWNLPISINQASGLEPSWLYYEQKQDYQLQRKWPLN